MMSGPPKLAVIWFGDNERALCTTIGSLAFPFGSILGFAMPLAFYPHEDVNVDWTVEQEETMRSSTEKYIFWQTLVITLCFIPIIVFI